jgi:hypothetical protein
VPEADVRVLFFDGRPDPVFDTATKSASLAGDYLGAKFVANPAAKATGGPPLEIFGRPA